jgi:hypothetical protein
VHMLGNGRVLKILVYNWSIVIPLLNITLLALLQLVAILSLQ